MPKQVITGEEPETITFELPVKFDALADDACLRLLLDAVNLGGSEVGVQECRRATNGNCRIVWHAIYDAPGLHALRVEFSTSQPPSVPGLSPLPGLSSMPGMPRTLLPLISGPVLPFVNSNLCQFSLSSANYDEERGAIFHGRLPEMNGTYAIDCTTTNGAHLKTLTGSTSNGVFKAVWDLVDDNGHRLSGETFDSVVHITLPDSGRTQTLRGP